MLIENSHKRTLKTISFRADSEVVQEFKSLCKTHKIKQVVIIENAMRKAILEIKQLGVENDKQDNR